MALIVTFLLGIGNFACHTAVLGSGHGVLAQISSSTLQLLRRASFVLEFSLLCGALYAVDTGQLHWVWFYAGYTLINAGAAWSIISGRV